MGNWFLGAALLILLGSVAHVGFTFSVWTRSSPDRSGSTVWIPILRELLFTILGALTWPIGLLPLPRLRHPKAGTPVLLVHGYLMTWANFMYIWPALRIQGIGPIYPITLGRWLSSTERQIEVLSRRIDAVRTQTGADQVDVVAHSMGGVLSRKLQGLDAQSGARSRIRRIVTLGTPHQGTRLAELAIGGGRALRAGSTFLRSLPPPEAVTSIWSTHDNVIVPATSAIAGGNAISIRLENLGHFALLFSKPVVGLITVALRAPTLETSPLADPATPMPPADRTGA